MIEALAWADTMIEAVAATVLLVSWWLVLAPTVTLCAPRMCVPVREAVFDAEASTSATPAPSASAPMAAEPAIWLVVRICWVTTLTCPPAEMVADPTVADTPGGVAAEVETARPVL